MIHPFSIDLEDWYQGIELDFSEWEGKERRLEIGMNRILEILDERNQKCTFFALGWVGEHYPDMIKKLAKEGHEIASHGYKHDKVYDMTKDEFFQNLSRSKKVLEDVSGQEVKGYRAPFFSITRKSLWGLEVIKKCGFEYDCSISPIQTWRYGIDSCPEEIFIIDELDLIEFPVNSFKFFGKKLAIGGAYFRIFSFGFTANTFKKNTQFGKPTMFYAHPWEYDPDHPVVQMERKAKFTHYFNLKGMAKRTQKLTGKYSFGTVQATLNQESKKSQFKRISIKSLQN